MKHCSICGAEIILGVNGCTWYSACFDCKPVRYYQKPMKPEESWGCTLPDYEAAIMARQERYMPDP